MGDGDGYMSMHHRRVPWSIWDRFRRLKVFKRDKWRCTRCGKAGRLEAHHVIPLHEGGEYLDPSNIVTMCRTCHVRHHRRQPTPDQIEWMKYIADLRD